MKNSQSVIYVGAFRFPDKDAAAKRVLGNAYAMRELGYNVIFAGGERDHNSPNSFQGFNYYSMSELDNPNNTVLGKLINYLQSGYKTLKWLEEYCLTHSVNKVIIYNSSGLFISRILAFCKNRGIEVIADITEWYDPKHLPGGKFGPLGIDNWLKMSYIYPKISKLIVISSYLENFYKKNNVLVIPPLITDINSNKQTKLKNSKIRIVYVGSPGLKDNLGIIIDCLNHHKDSLSNIEIIIAGISREDFKKIHDIEIGDSITFLGRISKQEVELLYAKADFSFLFRPNERFANAGFPTKFVESLSFKTPVIANITSDLHLYLKNRINGFVINSLDQKCLLSVLTEINDLSKVEIAKMSEAAYITSLQFQFKEFKNAFKNFL